MTLSVRGLRVRREDREVLRGVDLDVAAGEICALMGASGAGKTTVLRAVAALQPFDAGSIAVDDVTLAPGPVPPQSQLGELRRHVGMVFQAHALFEHLCALDNVTLAPIHVLGWDRARAELIARELLEMLGVGHRASALPRQLSGGEAQRVKLSLELSKRDTGRTLYILDEPTTGLHFHDIALLLKVIHRLRDQGNTVVIIEHNLDVIKTADWIVDLGPEGGAGGGQIIASGTPEQIAENAKSVTGKYLAPLLQKK